MLEEDCTTGMDRVILRCQQRTAPETILSQNGDRVGATSEDMDSGVEIDVLGAHEEVVDGEADDDEETALEETFGDHSILGSTVENEVRF